MMMMRHSVNNNTRMGLVIFLCSNSNHLISLIPRTVSNFRHLLSCGKVHSLSSGKVAATHLKICLIAIFAFYCLNYSLAALLQDNSRPKSPTKVETKRKLQQFTVSGWLIINGVASDSEKRKL